MSREVRIHDMPEEEKDHYFSPGMTKIMVTVITGLIILVIGQGLLIWRNQDNLIQDVLEIKDNLAVVHVLSDRVLKLEQYKETAYGRLNSLELGAGRVSLDRSQRGGAFRRDDANDMNDELTDKITSLAARQSTTEIKVSNLESRMLECRSNLTEDLEDLEDDIESLEEDHDDMYNELSSKCDKLIEENKL